MRANRQTRSPLNLVGPDERADEAVEARLPHPGAQPAAEVLRRDQASEPPTATTKTTGKLRRWLLISVVALLMLGAGGWYGERWWTVGRFIVTTDDAYVRADNTTLAAKISGYISAIRVSDNTRVRAGEVIATIDDGDYRLAVDAARDKLATQQATVERISRQIEAQQASVDQAKAQLASAEAGLPKAQADLERQQALAAKDFTSRQNLEQAQASRDQAVAAVQGARAGVDAAQAAIAVLKAQQQEAERGLAELKTALAKAERDLSFTVVRAPVDGVLGNRAVQSGDYVQPGQRLAVLVPLDAVYIDANFKETQLARLRPGQDVSLSVDAVPDRTIDTTVASVAPAAGSVFSLLPPDNATGNFTKIVQRVPVRIRVPTDVASEGVLRPGMSVVVSVNTKSDQSAGNNTVIHAAAAAAKSRSN